MEDHRQFKKN